MIGAATSTPASVLLVEDEWIIAAAEARALENAGYRVRTVSDGATAVAAATETPEIDIVLMDIDLGAGIDGPEAARRILADREVPIVFLTSHAEQSFVDRVEAITKYGYVLKSAGTFTLLQSIKTALELFDAHRTLRRSEDRFRTLFENTPTVSIQGYAPDGTVRFWNRASETLYGYTAEEAIGGNLLDLIIPETMRDSVTNAIRTSVETGEPIPASELTLRKKDGSAAEVYSSHALLRGDDGTAEVFCLDMDISERKRVEEALRREEENYRTLVQQQSELVVRVDADGRFEFVSDSYCRLFGKRRSELIGNSFMPLVHEEDRERTRRAMEELRVPPHRCRLEQRAWTVDGWRWLEWDDTAIVDDTGAVVAILGAGRDVTDRKSAEEERREILDSLPIPVVISKGPGERVEVVNEAFTQLFGYTIVEMPDAARWFQLAYPDPEYRRTVQQQWKDRLATAKRTGEPAEPLTVDARAMDGTVRTVNVRTHLLGEKLLITFIDLTDINAVQRRLEHSVAEKDRLMLELNHRVKNNLSLVASLIAMKEAELPSAVDLSDIRGQISAIGLIHEKLFSTGETRRIDLRAYLEDLLTSVFSFYPGNSVRIVNKLADTTLPTATTVTLGVLVNELAVNAMKHGFVADGEPVFTVSSELVDGSTDAEESRMRLMVSNNGRPFPATVDPGTAPTLGLQLVTALAGQLNGAVELAREPETRFTITIPLQN